MASQRTIGEGAVFPIKMPQNGSAILGHGSYSRLAVATTSTPVPHTSAITTSPMCSGALGRALAAGAACARSGNRSRGRPGAWRRGIAPNDARAARLAADFAAEQGQCEGKDRAAALYLECVAQALKDPAVMMPLFDCANAMPFDSMRDAFMCRPYVLDAMKKIGGEV